LGNLFLRLRLEVNKLAATDCDVLTELDWHVGPAKVVRPDVVICCPRIMTLFIESPPRLVAEVISPSTMVEDPLVKQDVYRQEGVEYYLLIDADALTAQAHALNSQGEYELLPWREQIQLGLPNGQKIEVSKSQLFT
jgi:Uma2 family endonuclease